MSHRGSNLSEGVVLTDGRTAAGVLTTFSFEGGELIVCKNQDLEPDLLEVQAMRERNAARRFASDIKEIGRIPEIFYSRICMIADQVERKKAVRRFFLENPRFCAYTPYLTNNGAKRQAGPASMPLPRLGVVQLAQVLKG